MVWYQKNFTLPRKSRGCYLVTENVMENIEEIKNIKIGMLNLFMQHTSAALTLNENWDPDVRADMTDALSRAVPEGSMYRHSDEGPDDMPGHVKSSMVGVSLNIPISNGRLALGTWQGIWLCEFRSSSHSRRLVATIQGEEFSK